jgi:5'(3')-deoxyribonucleotidase
VDKQIVDFKNNLVSNKLSGIALDIDETLAYTKKHWFEILNKKFGNPENLSLDELLAKYMYSQNVPYWQHKEALDMMQGFREDNSMHESIDLIDGAVEAVNEIHSRIPVCCYISARPQKVYQSTESWLYRNGFPRAEIILKPNSLPLENSFDWKSDILKFVFPEVVGIIDDNPLQVSSLVNCGYSGKIWLLGDMNLSDANRGVSVFDGWNNIPKDLTRMWNN